MEQVNYWTLLLKDEPKRYKVNHKIYGQTFNRLTVVSKITFKKDVTKLGYSCFASCNCGSGIKTYPITSLKTGNTKSCGCFNDETRKLNATHGLSQTRLYMTWRSMMSRCYSEGDINYRNYGERGISVCEEFQDVIKFTDWAHRNGYNDTLQIDRIDVNGNYEPDNIRFITHHQNLLNCRGNQNSTSKYKGVSWITAEKKWRAQITFNKKKFVMGSFINENDAARSYNEKAKKLFGEYAYLNIIEGDE